MRYKHNVFKNIIRFIVAALAFFIIFSGISVKETKADAVTDYLGVCVGYMGMDLDTYVEVGDWHFSELEGSSYEENYSFMDYSGGNSYRAIVDAAYGISIKELLRDYAHINLADIASLKFFVVAEGYGIRTTFDYDALFNTPRYYFNDIAKHRRIIYKNDDTYLIDSFDFEEGWTDCYEVEPMLALEDNWAQFNEEHESIGPDFDNLNPSTRFRLLFGQTSPTESQTGLSDKYVRYVYVTLKGSPSFGEMTQLDGSYGTHEVEMVVSSQNGNMKELLSEYLGFESTNPDALRIIDVQYDTYDEWNGDLAKIKVKYEIIGDDPNVSIVPGYINKDGNLDTASLGQTDVLAPVNTYEFNQPEEPEDPEDPEQPSDEDKEEDQKPADEKKDNVDKDKEKESEKETTTAQEKETTAAPEKETTKKPDVSQGKDAEGSDKGNSREGETAGAGNLLPGDDDTNGSNNNPFNNGGDKNGTGTSLDSADGNGGNTDKIVENENYGGTGNIKNEVRKEGDALGEADGRLALSEGGVQSVSVVDGKTLAYQLSGDVAGKLSGLLNTGEAVKPEFVSDRDITEVKLEDRTDENTEKQKMILIITGICFLAVCVIGALFEVLSFRFRLKKSMKEELLKIKNRIKRGAKAGA